MLSSAGGEVADADGADFAGVDEGFQCGVGGEVGGGGVVSDGGGACGFGKRAGAAGEGIGPVHQVEVEVVGGEVGEGGVAGGFDVGRVGGSCSKVWM